MPKSKKKKKKKIFYMPREQLLQNGNANSKLKYLVFVHCLNGPTNISIECSPLIIERVTDLSQPQRP